MSLLASALVPRPVAYRVYRGLDGAGRARLEWREAYVRPPTVADALAVFALASEGAASPGAAAGEHRASLLAVAARWLPPSMASDLRAFTDGPLASALLYIVAETSGATDAQREDAEDAADDVRASFDSLDGAVLALALQMGEGVASVLALPWPVFLAAARELPEVRRRAFAEAARAAQLGHWGTEEAWAALDGAARGPRGEVDEAERDDMALMNDHIERGFASREANGDARYWLYPDPGTGEAIAGPLWGPGSDHDSVAESRMRDRAAEAAAEMTERRNPRAEA